MTHTLEKQIDLQKVSNDTYTAAWHEDWTVGPALHGGCLAAVIRLAAVTHLRSDPSRFRNQPHLLNLHLDFLYGCERDDMKIVVTVLKVGALVSTLQLQLLQKEKVKVIAMANSTNFNQEIGPTVATSHPWAGLPPKPRPDFDLILQNKPDANWVPLYVTGEILPMMGRFIGLWPRGSFVAPGICDAWYTMPGEQIDETCMTFMTDYRPSMSDTLLKNGGMHDANGFRESAERWTEEHPGTTCHLEKNLKDAVKALTLDNEVSIDIEYKRSLPKEGLRFVFVRYETQMLSGGRMDISVTICNEDMELLCVSRHVVLVLEAARRFGGGKNKTLPSKM